MGLFNKLFRKEETVELPRLNVSEDAIVAPADGELIDVASVSDAMFSEKMLGDSVAFKYTSDKVVICSPANGRLSVLFVTGHAFGIHMENGVELLVHIGVDTVNANGVGFRILNKKQGDQVKAGDPIVEVDIKKLSEQYDMSTMLIITDAKGKIIKLLEPCTVKRGQLLTI